MKAEARIQRATIAAAPRPPTSVAVHTSELRERPDIIAQLASATRVGHSISAVNMQSRSSVTVQPKLAFGSLNDMPAPVQRQDELDEEQGLQTKPLIQRLAIGNFETDGDFESRLNSRRGRGAPLPTALRTEFEPKFGTDFGRVRIHTEAQSHQLNQSIQAEVFTTGKDAFFGQEAYSPRSRGGWELLAHDLRDLPAPTTPIQRKILVKGSEYRGSRKDTTEVIAALSDPFIRYYESESEMKKHLVSRTPVQVGLVRPLALWYRLPLLNKEFFVLGESHNAVTAKHIQDESGLKKSLLYEAAPGWTVGEAPSLSKEKRSGTTAGLDENSSKLLRALEMFVGISQRKVGVAPGGPVDEVPSLGGGTRRAVDGSYKLMFPSNAGGSDPWAPPAIVSAEPRTVGDFNPADQAFAAVEELLPQFMDITDSDQFDHVLGKKESIAFGNALLGLSRDPKSIKDPVMRLKEMKSICRGLLPAVQRIAADKYAEMSLPRKHKTAKVDLGADATADDYRDEYMLHRIIMAAKSKQYMLAGLGDKHLRRIDVRLKAAGIPFVTMADFYGSKYSRTAIDVSAVDEQEGNP